MRNKRMSVFKQTLSLLAQVTYQGVSDGALYEDMDGVARAAYYASKLNAVKTEVCGAGSCLTLPNGARVYLQYASPHAIEKSIIAGVDWNGLAAPNVYANQYAADPAVDTVDSVSLSINSTSSFQNPWGHTPLAAGQMKARSSVADAGSATLFKKILGG